MSFAANVKTTPENRIQKIETCRNLNLSTKCEREVNAFANGLELRFRFRLFGRPLLPLVHRSLVELMVEYMPKWFIVWHFIRYDPCAHSTRAVTLVLHESATLLGHFRISAGFGYPALEGLDLG